MRPYVSTTERSQILFLCLRWLKGSGSLSQTSNPFHLCWLYAIKRVRGHHCDPQTKLRTQYDPGRCALLTTLALLASSRAHPGTATISELLPPAYAAVPHCAHAGDPCLNRATYREVSSWPPQLPCAARGTLTSQALTHRAQIACESQPRRVVGPSSLLAHPTGLSDRGSR